MHVNGNLATEERLAFLRQALDNAGAVRIADAAKELGVSDMTVRRDLLELEAMGVARRVRGGAVAVGPVVFAERHQHRARAKARIAAKASTLVPPSGSVGFDASSTVLRLASLLEGGRDLMAVTNGLETFQALQARAGVRAVLTGGELDPRTGSLVGPLAARSAGQVLLRRLFVSSAGIDPVLGTSEATVEEADVKRALAAVSADVVLLLDSSKLGARGLATAVEWSQISTLVTDLDPDDKRLDGYRGLVKVL